MASHARTVVVPLANPGTAIDLLRVARAMLPDHGGRLIAQVVVLDDADAEKSREFSDGMQELVEVMADRLTGCTVTFRTRTATSVARGILDAIRDAGADAVVLGIRSREAGGGRSRLGPVVQSVIEAAACDVIVYRPAAEHGLDELERLLVAVDGELPSRNAVRVATFLRRGLRVDLELVHVQGPDASERHGHAVIAQSMAELVADRTARLEVVRADDVVAGLAATVRPTDLVVVGFGHEQRSSSMEHGNVGRALLDAIDVPMLTVARAHPSATGLHERLRRAAAWLHPRLTDVEQATMRSYAEGAAATRLDYLVMTVLSGVLASFGLLLDSSAVIIGAMLVAPLMQPLQGFGIGVVASRARLAMQALGTVLLGSAAVFVVAILAGLAVGVSTPTAEMLSRGSPSLLDAAVALAAGMAGAYATARKDIPAALAGVAIAAALVPPIGAAGLGVAAGRGGLAAGASLLFAVNITCIAVVSAVVFQWMGLRPSDRSRTEAGQTALAMASVGALVVLIGVLIVVDARRVRVDERPLLALLADAEAEVALAEMTVLDDVSPPTVRVVVDAVDLDAQERGVVAEEMAAEVRRQLGRDARTRLVVRDVVPVD